jgi:hypothetical protein
MIASNRGQCCLNINAGENYNSMSKDNKEQEHDENEGRKEVTIIVNTREKKWDKKEISYKEVVVLAFGSYSDDPNVVYTVTYSKGERPHQEGSLVKGESVKVKDGMIFNVTQTNKS